PSPLFFLFTSRAASRPYTLSLHDALPISGLGSSAWQMAREITAVDVVRPEQRGRMMSGFVGMSSVGMAVGPFLGGLVTDWLGFRDRKSTRLNSSHVAISYAVFCLKKKNKR